MIDGDVAYVPLTKGYTAVIDAADVPLVDGFNWQALVSKRKKTVYAVRSYWTEGREKHKLEMMHRRIMAPDDDQQIDHANGDGLTNRRHNLRVATQAQNSANRSTPTSNKSGRKGVIARAGRYRAKITVDKVQRSLGTFDTLEAAGAAYDEASARLHAEYSRSAKEVCHL